MGSAGSQGCALGWFSRPLRGEILTLQASWRPVRRTVSTKKIVRLGRCYHQKIEKLGDILRIMSLSRMSGAESGHGVPQRQNDGPVLTILGHHRSDLPTRPAHLHAD